MKDSEWKEISIQDSNHWEQALDQAQALLMYPPGRSSAKSLYNALEVLSGGLRYLATSRTGLRAIIDVVSERRRQSGNQEGYSAEHDDEHVHGELALAAAGYALPSSRREDPPAFWSFAACDWKPGDRRRELVKAGALILAELERLDRAESAVAIVQGSNT